MDPVVGVSVKALLHIRLFSVSMGPGKEFPVGVESLVQLFEPWLLRTIDLDHFNAVGEYVLPRAQKFTNPDIVRRTISMNIPRSFSKEERAALNADANTAQTSSELLELYLSYVGRAAFERVFPL